MLDEYVAEGDTASIERIGIGNLEYSQVVEGQPNTDGSGRLQRPRIVEPSGNYC